MKKVMKTILGLGLSVSLLGCLTTQGLRVISGVVTDVNDNPVAGAIVTTTPPTSAVATDRSGHYMIKAAKEGQYTLHVNKLGYVTVPADTKVTIEGPNFIQGDIKLIPEEMVPQVMPAPVYEEPAAAPEPLPVPVVVPAQEETGASKADEGEQKSGKAWWEK